MVSNDFKFYLAKKLFDVTSKFCFGLFSGFCFIRILLIRKKWIRNDSVTWLLSLTKSAIIFRLPVVCCQVIRLKPAILKKYVFFQIISKLFFFEKKNL